MKVFRYVGVVDVSPEKGSSSCKDIGCLCYGFPIFSCFNVWKLERLSGYCPSLAVGVGY